MLRVWRHLVRAGKVGGSSSRTVPLRFWVSSSRGWIRRFEKPGRIPRWFDRCVLLAGVARSSAQPPPILRLLNTVRRQIIVTTHGLLSKQEIVKKDVQLEDDQAAVDQLDHGEYSGTICFFAASFFMLKIIFHYITCILEKLASLSISSLATIGND